MDQFRAPGHRWVRYRHWLGVPKTDIHGEATKYLGLPGFSIQGDALVESILEDAPEPPRADFTHLGVIEGGKAKKKPKRKRKVSTKRVYEEALGWALLPQVETLDQQQYERRHRLNYYCRAPAGKTAVINAVRLWQHGLTREIVCAAFLRGYTAAQVSDLLRSKMKSPKRSELAATRPIDLETYQDLFWDFRDWGPSERALFFDRHPGLLYASTALTQPLDVVLSRMGLQPLKVDKHTTRELVKQLTVSWMHAQQGEIVNSKNPAGLFTAYSILQAVWDDEKEEAGSDKDALSRLQKTGVRVIDVDPIPGFAELQDQSTRMARYEDVNTALDLGAISSSEAEEYRDAIEAGDEIGTVLRDRIASVKADLVEEEGREVS